MEFVLVLFGYLLGSIPTGYILGFLAGVDVRKAGSGNVGATNVARVVGKRQGLLTLVADHGDCLCGRGRLLGPPFSGVSEVSGRQRGGHGARCLFRTRAPGQLDLDPDIYCRYLEQSLGFTQFDDSCGLSSSRALVLCLSPNSGCYERLPRFHDYPAPSRQYSAITRWHGTKVRL